MIKIEVWYDDKYREKNIEIITDLNIKKYQELEPYKNQIEFSDSAVHYGISSWDDLIFTSAYSIININKPQN